MKIECDLGVHNKCLLTQFWQKSVAVYAVLSSLVAMR